MNAVLVVADGTSPSLESRVSAAAEFGRRLASQTRGDTDILALGAGPANGVGARRLWRAQGDGRACAAAVRRLLAEEQYAAIVLAETPLSREVAGRLAVLSGLPLVAPYADEG